MPERSPQSSLPALGRAPSIRLLGWAARSLVLSAALVLGAWAPGPHAQAQTTPGRATAETATAETATKAPAFPEPEAQILLLGTFHFKDAGLDGYKPQFDIDVQSPERQREVEQIVEALAAFAPTRVAVEAKSDRQGVLDERYRAYLSGDFELPSNEIYQLGFRLAKRLGHERVWAVDAEARYYQPWVSPEDWAKENGQAELLDPMWDLRFEALYRYEDELKTQRSLAETLLAMNSEERLLRGHGHYLVGAFEVGSVDAEPGESGEVERFPGVDAVTGWYNRNLRIFANLQRLAQSPAAAGDDDRQERILLIIGAGHVPILRHAAQASAQFGLVEVETVLGRLARDR